MERFAGRLAVVTGAAGGIGRAVAQRLHDEGASLALMDIGGDAVGHAAAELGGAAKYVVDVGAPDQITAAFADVRRDVGDPHILVNNAAHLDERGTVLDLSPSDWSRALDGTLSSVYHASREVLPSMLAQRSGTIVNIASVGGVTGFENAAAYTTAKAAVIQLTRALAIDYGPRGVRVNAVSPGPIETPAKWLLPGYEALQHRQVEMTVLRRVGQPHEVAAAVAFLAADEASFVTGANLIVDGGWTLR